jgi:hypothetical protein
MKLSERLNEKILDNIKTSSFSPEVKGFLKAMLFVELRNFGIGERRYKKDYERNIRIFSKTYQVNK